MIRQIVADVVAEHGWLGVALAVVAAIEMALFAWALTAYAVIVFS